MMNGYEYTGMDAILAGSFRAAIYCRLSKDDDLDGESASIANQRDMLESYCEKQDGGCGSYQTMATWAEYGASRPETDGAHLERRQINLDNKRFIEISRNYSRSHAT